ncbi:MAG: sigma-70 family RNA polymerase sigma factor [Kofleriaceae bacterium]
MSEIDDKSLLERWRAGDAPAGQTLFRRHFDSIYGFFATKCPAEADELVQSTFLACVNARDQFRGESSFRTYLFTIARHQLYRLLASRQRAAATIDFDLSSIAEIVTTPGTLLVRGEEHRQLVTALQRLPVEQQTLLELHYWQELGMAELAEVFEVTEQVIRTRLHRARKALHLKLERLAPKQALETLESMDVWVRKFSQAG